MYVKFTGISICFISKIKEEAVSSFLHLEKLENDKTALAISNAVRKVLYMYGMQLHNIVSICECLETYIFCIYLTMKLGI